MTLAARCLAWSLFSIAALPQSLKQPAFEVASVKPTTAANARRVGFDFQPGGRLVATNVPLSVLISAAYELPMRSSRLSGGPDWISSERYDIEAVAEKDAIPAGAATVVRNEKMRSMLQGLLADRFQLKMRRETKELPVYVLTIARNGPKLQASKSGDQDCPDEGQATDSALRCHEFQGGQGRGIHAHAVSTRELALFVANWADRPVLDKTGLSGLYDIDTEGWTPMLQRPQTGAEPTAEDIANGDPTRPTLYMVLAKLGLRLESQKAPIELFVIESVSKLSGN